jgi:hypothetical protein
VFGERFGRAVLIGDSLSEVDHSEGQNGVGRERVDGGGTEQVRDGERRTGRRR